MVRMQHMHNIPWTVQHTCSAVQGTRWLIGRPPCFDSGISPRAGFLQGLTLGIARQAIRGGLCSSASFKTSKTYLLQTLALDAGARSLLDDYVTTLRPLVADAVSGEEDSKLLFLNSQGTPLHDTSRTVSVLWEASFGRKMTLTVLRYWKQTHIALQASTSEQRERILRAEAHSGTVARKWYQKVWGVMDAALAKRESDSLCKLGGITKEEVTVSPMTICAELASKETDAISLRPQRKKRRVPWGVADTELLMKSAPLFADQPDRWERCLAHMLPHMEYNGRSAVNLKDRYRTCMQQAARAT